LASNIPPLPILQVPTPPLESPPFPVSNIKPKKIGYFWTGAGDNNHKDFLVVTSLDDVTSPLLTLFVLSLQDDRTHLVPSSILLMFQPVETPHTTLGLLWMARPSWEAVSCRFWRRRILPSTGTILIPTTQSFLTATEHCSVRLLMKFAQNLRGNCPEPRIHSTLIPDIFVEGSSSPTWAARWVLHPVVLLRLMPRVTSFTSGQKTSMEP
jgi:hypothetical protein